MQKRRRGKKELMFIAIQRFPNVKFLHLQKEKQRICSFHCVYIFFLKCNSSR